MFHPNETERGGFTSNIGFKNKKGNWVRLNPGTEG